MRDAVGGFSSLHVIFYLISNFPQLEAWIYIKVHLGVGDGTDGIVE